MLIIMHMKPRDATRGVEPCLRPTPFFFRRPGSNLTGYFIAFRSRHDFGQTRCFGYPGALVTCHPDIPSLAQLQANREGALFSPRLILFREGLSIVSGN